LCIVDPCSNAYGTYMMSIGKCRQGKLFRILGSGF
jgi:hypothetical protein